jgi:CBS domain-containing protein
MATHCRARTIREIMTRGPKTVGRKLAVRALRDLFIAYGFNAFPVVDEADTLLGIVTKVDLLRVVRHDRRRILPDLAALEAKEVENIMRRGVTTVRPDDPVTTAVDVMISRRLRSLPVVESQGRKERLVGIVTRGDVLRVVTFETSDHG